MLNATMNLRDAIENFAPHETVGHALLLTYNFDGLFLEDSERGLLEALWMRNCVNTLVVRDGKAVLSEKRSHRYSIVNAAYSTQIFHSKLLLLLSASEAMAVIGSANLTRGGLENNLELASVYSLTRNEGPRRFFAALHAYLDQGLRRELVSASARQRDAFDRIVNDFGRFLTDSKSTRSPTRGEPLLLHNYNQPLLPQLEQALPSTSLDALWIVSPFFEPDGDNPDEDPPSDAADDTLVKQIFSTFSFTSNHQPPVRIYFQASFANVTQLPLKALEPFQSDVALYALCAKNPASIDQRKLHAKMMVFMGGQTTGKPFVTIAYGSANFTRAALLSKPPRGNAEILVVTHCEQPIRVANKLADYLNLDQLFIHIEDPSVFTTRPTPRRPETPVVQVWEGLVSIEKNTVTIYFRVNGARAQRARVTLVGEEKRLNVGEAPLPLSDGESVEFDLPVEVFQCTEAQERLQRIPFHCAGVEVLDSSGKSLGYGEGPLNVDCPEMFCGDWLCRPDELRLDNQIYLAGMGIAATATYPALRAYVERIVFGTSGGESDSALPPTYQADLDLFFRRLHIGFRGLQRRLEQANGSRYIFGEALRLFAQWGCAAVSDHDLTSAQQLYLCGRILRAVQEAIGATKIPGHSRHVLAAMVRDEFLARAKAISDFADSLRSDKDVGVVARDILATWRLLTEAVK